MNTPGKRTTAVRTFAGDLVAAIETRLADEQERERAGRLGKLERQVAIELAQDREIMRLVGELAVRIGRVPTDRVHRVLATVAADLKARTFAARAAVRAVGGAS